LSLRLLENGIQPSSRNILCGSMKYEILDSSDFEEKA